MLLLSSPRLLLKLFGLKFPLKYPLFGVAKGLDMPIPPRDVGVRDLQPVDSPSALNPTPPILMFGVKFPQFFLLLAAIMSPAVSG